MQRVSALKIDWPASLEAELISTEEYRQRVTSAVKEQKVDNGIDAQTVVVSAGGDLWRSLKEWGETRHLLTPTEVGILDVAASIPSRIPTDRQSMRVMEALRRLHTKGCQIGLDIV